MCPETLSNPGKANPKATTRQAQGKIRLQRRISYSGESHEIKTIVDRIVDNKGTIIAITSINDSYLRKRANYCLTMCSKENIVSKIETYSSKLSSDYLMDLIFSILFQKDYYPNLIRKINCEQKYEKKTDHDM